MDPQLLNYYEAIERASADMLEAARAGHWDEVVKLEGACVLLISQLKHAAQVSTGEADVALHAPRQRAAAPAAPAASGATEPLPFDALPAASSPAAPLAEPRVAAQAAAEAARSKARIMQRILMNDAEIRQLAEPWLQTLDEALQGQRRTLH